MEKKCKKCAIPEKLGYCGILTVGDIYDKIMLKGNKIDLTGTICLKDTIHLDTWPNPVKWEIDLTLWSTLTFCFIKVLRGKNVSAKVEAVSKEKSICVRANRHTILYITFSMVCLRTIFLNCMHIDEDLIVLYKYDISFHTGDAGWLWWSA